MNTKVRTQIRPAPVRRSIFVNAPQAHAFEVFTGGIGRWWPKTHAIGDAEVDKPVIEPREGGRWYERGVDGSECEIGKVLAWEPPARLLLAWQLDPDWKFDPDLITEVEVTFTPEAGGTRVEFEHRNLERLGDRAEEMAEKIGSPGGWTTVLQLYSEASEK
jgi:uncharacterized protein YndB with AHSA1/START domain